MRKDMEKVIVERPRIGSSNSYRPRRQKEKNCQLVYDEDGIESNAITKSKMVPPGYADRKELNENLNPLFRFLLSKVDKSWNKTYSEIREHFGVNSATSLHIFQHVKQFVETSPMVINGCLLDRRGYLLRAYRPGQQYSALYVDNKGILRLAPYQGNKYVEPEKLCITLDDNWFLVKLEGIWYKIQGQKTDPGILKYYSYIHNSFVVGWPKDLDPIFSSKKQLNSKELKHYKLKND